MMFVKCMKYLFGCFLIVLFMVNFLIMPFILVTTAIMYSIIFAPFPSLHTHRRKVIHMIMAFWMGCFRMVYLLNNWHSLDVEAVKGVKKDGNYILLCNHASWFDIVLLSTEIGPYIPQYKFILKKILLWALPLSGFVPWLLDFPFLNRFSHAKLKKNPQLRNLDINIIRDGCRLFRNYPSTLILFPEGTRFTDAKHAKQKSMYTHLLKPKVTGMAIIMDELKDSLDGIIDVTIHYSKKKCFIY